jgi:hypothetical protein
MAFLLWGTAVKDKDPYIPPLPQGERGLVWAPYLMAVPTGGG